MRTNWLGYYFRLATPFALFLRGLSASASPGWATLRLLFAPASGARQNLSDTELVVIAKMRVAFAIVSFALITLHGTVSAGPLRACAQVSTLVDGAITPLLAKEAASRPDSTQLRAQLRGCLSARNICSVVYDAQHGREGLVAGNTTADLPAQSGQGKSSVILLVRSIPPVRNDPNQYCLISEKLSGGSSPEQWDVHGWVIAPKTVAGEALPLQRQALEYKSLSDPRSLRSLAAALWFFAERMSGQPSPSAKSSEE